MAQRNSQGNFSDAQFQNMQQEAIKRVMEMQKRSNSIVNSHNNANQRQSAPLPKPPESIPQNQQNNHTQNSSQNDISSLLSSLINGSHKNDILNSLLNEFKPDEEKIILGILIYILAKNGADLKLILALAYLII